MNTTTTKDFWKFDPALAQSERGKLYIENHNRKVDEIDLAQQYGDLRKLCKMITITEHSPKSKMAHKHSLSTSVMHNQFCQTRQCMGCRADGKEPVCPYCFAEAINNARPTVKYATTRNHMILTKTEIPARIWHETWVDKFRAWNEPDFRIASLGDANNTTEVKNYINLESAMWMIMFSEWSKNDAFWYRVFEEFGKPKNSIYIHSSLYLNEIDDGPEWMQKYIDYIFTVFTEEYARRHPEIVMNCCTLDNKGRQCRRDCNECYSMGNCRYRNELVRGYKKGAKKRV